MKEKVVYLIHDERRYISRTIIAAFPCFLIGTVKSYAQIRLQALAE